MKKFVTLILFFGMINRVNAQQFSQQAGAQNILNGIDIGTFSAPVLVDIDNDTDLDMFAGTGGGLVVYFKNTGTTPASVFTQQSTENNPLGTLDVGGSANLSFVDIDNDGDFDAFVGSRSGYLLYYRNDGNKTTPVFTLETSNNPLSQVLTELQSSSCFVDIDGDLDMDAFIGGNSQSVAFYRNIGTPQNASYLLMSPSDNPLQLNSPSALMFPNFIDADRDGDSDAFLGSSSNSIAYYQNVGSQTNPIFTRQTGNLNPLNSFTQAYAFLSFGDLNSDGDMDVVIGLSNGTFSSYQNNTFNLPVKLIAFTAVATSNIAISWKTADEVNTLSFELQKSNDGKDFTSFKTVPAIGAGSNSYSARDNVPVVTAYYRLKMVDVDGSYTYSPVIQTNSGVAFKMHLYPIPAEQTLTIEFPTDFTSSMNVKILDISGRTRMSTTLNSRKSQIPISFLDKGTYVLKIQNGDSYLFVKK